MAMEIPHISRYQTTIYGWYSQLLLWMEEILHQLVGGLSSYSPIIYSVS